MSGDCGHGWMYHDSASSPCKMCKQQHDELKQELTEMETFDLDPAVFPSMTARVTWLRWKIKQLRENW